MPNIAHKFKNTGKEGEAKSSHFYTRDGLIREEGDKKLIEGMFVLPDPNSAIGFGVSQSGADSMELSYVVLARLPQVKINRKSTSNRNMSVNNQVNLIFGTMLGEFDLTIRHTYVVAGKGIQNESYFVLDKQFDPQAGRLILADLTASPPTYEQLNVELPQIDFVKKFDNVTIGNVATKLRGDLHKSNEAVRKFVGAIEELEEEPEAEK